MKQMIRKGYLLLAVLLLVIPGISQAATIYTGSLVDTSSGINSGTYSLLVTDDGVGADTYSATLTVDTNVVANAYIDWFTVHFDTPAAEITSGITGTNVTTATATGTWVEGAGQNLIGYGGGPGGFPTGPFTGGFEQGILDDGTINETGGFLLNGNVYAWTFDFTSAAPILGEGGNGFPNLQVGFYGSGVDGWPRLSQGFQVPEASALMLFSTGLAGLVIWRRKKRFE